MQRGSSSKLDPPFFNVESEYRERLNGTFRTRSENLMPEREPTPSPSPLRFVKALLRSGEAQAARECQRPIEIQRPIVF
jgi:hypothetical protein